MRATSTNFKSRRQRCSIKKVFLEISQISQENTCARVSFLIKPRNFVKKGTLAQVLSCEFCEISKNTFSYRTPPVAVSIENISKLLAEYICLGFVKVIFQIIDWKENIIYLHQNVWIDNVFSLRKLCIYRVQPRI